MGMSYRNFICSEVLHKVEVYFEITYVALENSSILKLLRENNKKVIELKIGKIQRIIRRCSSFFERLQYLSFYQKHKTETMKKYIERDKESTLFPFYYFLAKLIGCLYDNFSFVSLHYPYFIPSDIRRKMCDYDCIFILSSDEPLDKSFLRHSKNIKLKNYLMVHSWDNLPARGYLSAKPDKLFVWNQIMKKQALELHDLNSKNVEIVGVPQFYFYQKISKNINEKSFNNFYRLGGNKKVITYTCSACRVFPDEDMFIDELLKIIKKKELILILRLHPVERKDEYLLRYSNESNMILDTPGGLFGATVNNNISDDIEEIRKFVSLMKYSSIVINLASTTSLDAAIFNTPVICVSFNIDTYYNNKWNKAKEWYKSSHYKDIIESKSVRVVNDIEELEDAIEMYIINSDVNTEDRLKLSDNFCNFKYEVDEQLLQSFQT